MAGLTNARRSRHRILVSTVVLAFTAFLPVSLAWPGAAETQDGLADPSQARVATPAPRPFEPTAPGIAATNTPRHTPAVAPVAPPASAADRRRAAALLSRQPFSFIRNDGQLDPRVRYYAQRGGFASFFTPEAAMLVFRPAAKPAARPERAPNNPKDKSRGLAVALTFLGASPEARITGQEQTPGRYNFLRGAEPAAWQRDVPGFARVVYRELWPGIDMTFREQDGRLKYSFLVQPGADPGQIRLAYRGAEGLSLREDGALLIATELGSLVDEAPVSYQLVAGRKEPVATRFRLSAAADDGPTFGFELPEAHDPQHSLVIDPGLVFSTYLGGSGSESVRDLALDSLDRPVVVGGTSSSDFPTTLGAFDTTPNGGSDAFITKLSADGSALVFSTFLGGSESDSASDVALDSLDQPVVVGITQGVGFPTTPGAFDTTHGDPGVFQDIFVTKLTADGSALLFSTFLGGSSIENANDVVLDSLDRPVVVGVTDGSLPTTPGAFDTGANGFRDAFIAKLTADGSALVFSTFLGGGAEDSANSVALDSLDRPVVVGVTGGADAPGSDFPTTPGAFDTEHNGGRDAFVTQLSADGSALIFSTFLGGGDGVGSGDRANGVTLDSLDRPVVVGVTTSPDFPTTPNAFDTEHNPGWDVLFDDDAFVTKLTADGSALVFSTFLGGDAAEGATAVALDSFDRPVVVGSVNTEIGSTDFPTTPNAFDTTYNGGFDVFISQFSADGSTLVDSSFFGGGILPGGGGLRPGADEPDDGAGVVALDSADNVFIAGGTTSTELPVTPGAFQEIWPGGFDDGFIAKFAATDPPPAFPVTITAGPTADPNPVPASDGMSALSVSAEAGGDALAFVWSSNCPEGFAGDGFDDAMIANPTWTAPVNPGAEPITCRVSVEVSSSTDTAAGFVDIVVGPATTAGEALIVSSILPVSRSVQVGQLATAFATIINAGTGSALGCGIALGDNPGLSGSFLYQLTEPTTNTAIADPNSPIDIAAGGGSQSYVVAITPAAPFGPAQVQLTFLCDNAEAGQLPAINTLFFSASVDPVPDLVALVASLEPGFVTLPTPTGSGAFVVATANVGVAGEILVQPATELLGAGQPLPLDLLICQTGLDGLCLGDPAPSVTTPIGADETPSFAVFVLGQGQAIASDPALNRVFVTFEEGGILRGATSLAVRTAP